MWPAPAPPSTRRRGARSLTACPAGGGCPSTGATTRGRSSLGPTGPSTCRLAAARRTASTQRRGARRSSATRRRWWRPGAGNRFTGSAGKRGRSACATRWASALTRRARCGRWTMGRITLSTRTWGGTSRPTTRARRLTRCGRAGSFVRCARVSRSVTAYGVVLCDGCGRGWVGGRPSWILTGSVSPSVPCPALPRLSLARHRWLPLLLV